MQLNVSSVVWCQCQTNKLFYDSASITLHDNNVHVCDHFFLFQLRCMHDENDAIGNNIYLFRQ